MLSGSNCLVRIACQPLQSAMKLAVCGRPLLAPYELRVFGIRDQGGRCGRSKEAREDQEMFTPACAGWQDGGARRSRLLRRRHCRWGAREGQYDAAGRVLARSHSAPDPGLHVLRSATTPITRPRTASASSPPWCKQCLSARRHRPGKPGWNVVGIAVPGAGPDRWDACCYSITCHGWDLTGRPPARAHPSSTSRTFRANSAGLNGFERKGKWVATWMLRLWLWL